MVSCQQASPSQWVGACFFEHLISLKQIRVTAFRQLQAEFPNVRRVG